MKGSQYVIIPTIIVSLLLISCSPAPVFRLAPEEENTTFYYGTEYVQSDKDDILVSLAYYRHTENMIVFDVEIVNYSEQSVRVAPEYFYSTAYNGPPTHPDARAMIQMSAIDPEKMLIEIDKKQSREQASEKTNLALYATGEVLSLAGELANIGNDTSYLDREEARRDRIERRALRADQRYQYEAMVHSIAAQRSRWEYNTLRKTDLLPDQHIRGLVYVPGKPDARYFELVLPVGNTEHRFIFRQNRFDAAR
jgi:hypothetical protein